MVNTINTYEELMEAKEGMYNVWIMEMIDTKGNKYYFNGMLAGGAVPDIVLADWYFTKEDLEDAFNAVIKKVADGVHTNPIQTRKYVNSEFLTMYKKSATKRHEQQEKEKAEAEANKQE